MIKGIITEDGEKLFFSKVIIATGGYSYQSTGSTGDGYRFAKETGHRVTDILPALVPLVVKEECVKEMQGLSLKNIRADFYPADTQVRSADSLHGRTDRLQGLLSDKPALTFS